MVTTIQTLIIAPFKAMLLKVATFVPTLVSAFLVLIVGLIVAKVLHDIFHRLFKEIHLDKLADRVGLSNLLHKGGVKLKLSDLVSSLVYWVVMVMFLIMTAEVVGLTALTALLSTLVAYIPQVISAVFVLVMGMILAKIVGSLIYAIASNLGMPKPEVHRKVSHYAIVIYAAKISLEELGFGFLFVGTIFHIWFAGLALALALSYGLGHGTVLGGKKR